MLSLASTALLGARKAVPRLQTLARALATGGAQQADVASTVRDQAFLSFWPAEHTGKPGAGKNDLGAAQGSAASGSPPAQPGPRQVPPGAITELLSTDLPTVKELVSSFEHRLPHGPEKDSSTGWPVIVAKGLTQEEMGVAPLIVTFLRTGKMQLPGGSSPSAAQLTAVYKVASDRLGLWRGHPIMASTSAAIDALTPAQLAAAGTPTLLHLMSMAGHAVRQQAREQLQLRAQPLVQRFGDVTQVLADGEKRAAFLQLPLSDVLAWAGSSNLQLTFSENEVAAALDAWVRAQPEGSLSAEQQELLAARVRVQQLTPAYRLHFLAMDWVQPKGELLQLVGMLQSKPSSINPSSAEDTALGLDFPSAWQAGHRARLPAEEAEARRTVELSFTQEELDEGSEPALWGQLPIEEDGLPRSLFVNGHELIVSADMTGLRDKEDGDKNVAWVELEVRCGPEAENGGSVDIRRPPVYFKAEVEHFRGGQWVPHEARVYSLVPGFEGSYVSVYLLVGHVCRDEGKMSVHGGMPADGKLRARCKFTEVD